MNSIKTIYHWWERRKLTERQLDEAARLTLRAKLAEAREPGGIIEISARELKVMGNTSISDHLGTTKR